jgi:hypothetical protein
MGDTKLPNLDLATSGISLRVRRTQFKDWTTRTNIFSHLTMRISTELGGYNSTRHVWKATNKLPSTTFNLADWLAKTPRALLAKSFGLPESVFASLPSPNPYIQNGTTTKYANVTGGNGELTGDASYVYRTFQHTPEPAPGGGGQWWKIDSTNFPIAKTIASTYVVIEPKGVRELHWHPTVSLPRKVH